MKRIKSNPRGLKVTNVAQRTGMTRQAIHYNIQAGYLPAEKDDSGKYYISFSDYHNWRLNFYYDDIDVE